MMVSRKKTIVLGLTGSIGMGKSTASRMFARLGIPVLSADRVVHDLFLPEGAAYRALGRSLPDCIGPRGVRRSRLAKAVFSDPAKLLWLENLIHPLVFKACRAFIRQHKKQKAKAVVLEIPLLFETGFEASCDFTLCVSSPTRVQKERVMKRKGMTPARFKAILSRQMPDREKRKRADFVITSDKGRADTNRQITRLCQELFGEIDERNRS